MPSKFQASSFLAPLIGVLVLGCAGWMVAKWMGSFFESERRPGMTHHVARGNLVVTVSEQGLLESEENVEVKSKVRGYNAVLWIIESGTFVNAGDELVRLDALFIQEQVDERTKYANWSQSGADSSAARLARAKLAVEEYDQGRFRTEVLALEKDIAIAKSQLQSSRDRLKHATMMASSGFINELEVEERTFAVEQALLDVELKQTQLRVLKEFTYKEQLQTLKGDLSATGANHEANVERAMADASRRDRAVEELEYCVIKAERSGLVIHPNAAEWEARPIAEGTNVHRDQVLLLMPNLQKMRVKVGVHEHSVKRVAIGQQASVMLADGKMDAHVTEVASIAKPAGWWTGNQVRYDTYVALPAKKGLRPGMSAEVEIKVAEYQDVLLLPIAAIAGTDDDVFCFVVTPTGVEQRQISLGDSNGIYSVVTGGLEEGDEVILNSAVYDQLGTETAKNDSSST